MKIRLIRHATLKLEYAGHRLLVDPMLSRAGAMTAIDNSPNPRPNPLVELPEPVEDVLRGVEAVLVTHTHRDHWDAAAAEIIPKNMPLLGQPEDEPKFRAAGFTNVTPIVKTAAGGYPTHTWGGITIHRTGGRHGTGEIGKKMAPVSGFVLRASGEPTLYIAGDTIWCEEVAGPLHEFHPATTVVNAGGARFLQGDPITMTPEDVIRVCQAAPKTQVVAVHMDAINHCIVTREDLAFQLEAERLRERVALPADGEWVDVGISEAPRKS
ncbi:MAG: MBL fold metallo-hydrolase [Acidobacteriia bacterium]|nr:MBL fold metallo-hydrolase [Terriglobia bacterium]